MAQELKTLKVKQKKNDLKKLTLLTPCKEKK
jgi:hypothetical protein